MINKRVSVRNFEERAISNTDLGRIHDMLTVENRMGPFNTVFEVDFKVESELDKKEKLGTYGYIKNAQAYLVGYSDTDKYSLFEYGFMLEGLILKLTSFGIGTCWLGGTFDRSKLNKEGLYIPAISAAGYPKEKPHFKERIILSVIKPRKRKKASELFFQDDFNTPYTGSDYSKEFEYLRLSPSAKNLQPWRILVDESGVHFYLKRSIDQAKQEGDVQVVDIGIACRHFYEGIKELSKGGTFVILNNEDLDGLEYVVSWVE